MSFKIEKVPLERTRSCRGGVERRWAVVWFFLALTTMTFDQADAAWLRHTIDDTARGADGTRLADVNRDGLPDLTTGWEESGLIRVYLNPGTTQVKRPWPQVTIGQVGSPEDAVWVDLDQDGRQDVVSSCEGKNKTLFVHWAPRKTEEYLNADAWQTAAIPLSRQRESWMFVLPLAAPPETGIRLIAGSKGERGGISLLSAATPSRQLERLQRKRLRDAGWIMSLRQFDMDRDGDQDVLASDRKGENRGIFWLEQPPAAGAAWKEHFIGAGDEEAMFLDVRRHPDTEALEIVVPAKPRHLIHFRAAPQTPLAWQSRKTEIAARVGRVKAVRFADIDLDGRTDLVVTSEGAQQDLIGVYWFPLAELQRPAVTAVNDISGAAGVKFDRIDLADLDGDGDLDVITCEESDNLGVIWYENPAN